jgi:hypothetical protein
MMTHPREYTWFADLATEMENEMIDKDVVLSKYPDAYAFHYPNSGGWEIWRDTSGIPLSSGDADDTEAEAWADAAAKLKEA